MAHLSSWVYAPYPFLLRIPRRVTICLVRRNLRQLLIVKVSYGGNILMRRKGSDSKSKTGRGFAILSSAVYRSNRDTEIDKQIVITKTNRLLIERKPRGNTKQS